MEPQNPQKAQKVNAEVFWSAVTSKAVRQARHRFSWLCKSGVARFQRPPKGGTPNQGTPAQNRSEYRL
jgi:hypothetical protein